jgi:hypothetical protein
MSISVITNFDVNTSANIDARLGPYSSVAHATGSIPTISRYVGMTVLLTGSGAPVEYWFNPTTASTDLVVKSGGGVTGGTANYVAVWSGSTSLTTGSLYNNANGVGINNINPSYSLDINGDLRVTGSSGLIYHQNHKHGAINTTSVTSGSSATLLSFNYFSDVSYPTYYRGLFFDYEIEVTNGGSMQASRSGTLKTAIFYKPGGTVITAIQTTENSTPEYHYAIDDQYIGTENIVLSVTNTNNQIQLVCSNLINDNQYSSTIRGEWKLLSTI